MPIDPELISYGVNAVLIPTAGALLIKLRKSAPQIIAYAAELNTLRKQAKRILNVLGSIYTLTQTVDDALEDGNLSTEEAVKIIQEVRDLAGSPEVSALMEEFSAE